MLLLPTHSRWHLKLVLFVNDTTAIDSGTEKGMDWGGGILIGVCFELQWSNRLKANCLIQYSFCIKFGRFILFRLLLFCLVLGWTGECMVCTSKREQYRFDHVSSDAGIICTISTYLMNELIVCMWSINFKYQHSLILWFDWNPFELATAISFTILSCVQCSAVHYANESTMDTVTDCITAVYKYVSAVYMRVPTCMCAWCVCVRTHSIGCVRCTMGFHPNIAGDRLCWWLLLLNFQFPHKENGWI